MGAIREWNGCLLYMKKAARGRLWSDFEFFCTASP
jgi:hypothetical protein